MTTHSSILAWGIPGIEDPGRLQSMGSQRVRHDWATKHTAHMSILISQLIPLGCSSFDLPSTSYPFLPQEPIGTLFISHSTWFWWDCGPQQLMKEKTWLRNGLWSNLGQSNPSTRIWILSMESSPAWKAVGAELSWWQCPQKACLWKLHLFPGSLFPRPAVN